MSVSCEYEQLKYTNFTDDVSHTVSLEGQLQLPEGYPKIAGVIGGEFLTGTPNISVNDEELIVAGLVQPRLLYVGENDRGSGDEGSRRFRERSDTEETEGNLEEYRHPREYGIHWTGETGLKYEERIAIPGLKPGMTAEVAVAASQVVFEKIGLDRLNCQGKLDLAIHIASQQEARIVRDVTAQAQENIQLTKESITVEEVLPTLRTGIPFQTALALPNIKPGVARTLRYHAHPHAITWSAERGKLLVKGNLEISLVYVGCDDEGRPTEIFMNEWLDEQGTAIPFEARLDGDFQMDGMMAALRIIPSNMRMEIRSARDLRFLSDLECEVRLSRTMSQEVVADVTPSSGLILDTQKYLLNLEEFTGEMNGEIQLEQQLELPTGMDPERLLSYQGCLRDFTVEASEGKALIDGVMELWLLYTANVSDNPLFIGNWDHRNSNRIPVSGVLEAANLKSGTLLRSHLTLESLRLELMDGKNLHLTGLLKAQLYARTPRAIFVLKDCAVVQPVDVSTRPSMLFYIVQPGDSLWKIARRYQTTVASLAKVNQIANPDRIDVGQKLLIPKQIINM